MSDSLITKKAIASGMKELTRKKSFDKITVSDITQACGLNRQTFYYHFQDKFELVDWIYYNETISIIYNLNYDNWDSRILEMLTKIKAEDYFYMNTLKASVGNEFREYLFRVTVEFFCDLIGRVAENTNMGEEEIRFIAEFYAFGIVGVIISWAQKGMKETPEYITEQLKKSCQRYGTVCFCQVSNEKFK
jgi:probable dihydroxyacetone kinase regulator